MPRGINTATVDDLADGEVRIALNIFIDFQNPLYATTSNEPNIITGVGTFTPANNVISIGEVRDNGDLSASNLSVVLSGCDNAIVNASKNEQLQGTEVKIWLVFLDENGDTQTTLHYFTGYIENTVYMQSAKTITISVACQNFLARLGDRKIRRYTDEDQKDVYSADKGLEFVEQIQEKTLVWGE